MFDLRHALLPRATWILAPGAALSARCSGRGNRFDPLAARRPILVFENVHKAFRADAPVLRGLQLEIERGEFVFITGPSGAGKSTLLRLLYAADTVDSGRILFMGREIGRLTDGSVPFLRRNIGVVFQDFKLVDNWSVLENVALPLEVLGVPQRLARQRVGEALDRVGLGGRGVRIAPERCPAASNSAWPSRAPSSANQRWCSPTNRPAISIRSSRSTSLVCSRTSTRPA